jgi:hypothetical protein
MDLLGFSTLAKSGLCKDLRLRGTDTGLSRPPSDMIRPHVKFRSIASLATRWILE